MIEHSDLLKLLSYDPETGDFRWKVRKNSYGGKANVGSIAGGHTAESWGIRINGEMYLAHRLAWFYMTKSWPKEEIDHINRNRLDNRFCNLREANSQENKRNKSAYKNSKSGVKGVSWSNAANKWVARIHTGIKYKHLGVFSEISEAKAAYDLAAKKYHGEFACS